MKKFRFLLVMILGVFMALAFAACGTYTPNDNNGSNGDNSGITIGGGGNETPSDGEENGGNDKIPDKDEDTANILVVYFSATNNTKSVAEKIHVESKSDIFEIIPAVPYTSADINYHNSDCRAVVEQRNPSARPAIGNRVENFAEYDVVFIGYPIWGNDAPRIIYTFLDSYDFSGKTLIPFCTSGGSGIGGSERNLKAYKTNVTWLNGREFSRSTSSQTIATWLNGLNY